MYSDLFDHLGSSGANAASSSSNNNSNEKVLVNFKAGKMDLNLQENGNYWAAPDTRRGEIRIVWKSNENALHWEWYDRREKTVADRHVLYTADGMVSDLGTLERVQNVPNPQPQDRLYVWTKPQTGSNNPEYRMYWMQDASEEKDDEYIAQVNQYLADPASANPSSSSGNDNTDNNDNESGAAASGGGSAMDRQQVDTLSNILENLGMPQGAESSSPSAAGGDSARAPSAPTGTLTLADLQGAMAGLQQPGTGASQGPPLQELVTPAAINSLLENEEVKQKLLELLPEEQQTEEYLAENLRSPQVQQTLRSLTAALLPDDTGSLDGYHSVLANFNMAEHAQEALNNNSNNPIQAFLECVLKSVEEEREGTDAEKED